MFKPKLDRVVASVVASVVEPVVKKFHNLAAENRRADRMAIYSNALNHLGDPWFGSRYMLGLEEQRRAISMGITEEEMAEVKKRLNGSIASR